MGVYILIIPKRFLRAVRATRSVGFTCAGLPCDVWNNKLWENYQKHQPVNIFRQNCCLDRDLNYEFDAFHANVLTIILSTHIFSWYPQLNQFNTITRQILTVLYFSCYVLNPIIIGIIFLIVTPNIIRMSASVVSG